MEDYEFDDYACPKCGYEPTRWRRCQEVYCDDGWIDIYHEDPINYSPGEMEPCGFCHGTGILRWCPQCGADLQIRDDKIEASP